MKGKKTICLCLLLCLALGLSACGRTPEPAPTPTPTPPRSQMTTEGAPIESLEELCTWCSDIVKATLLSHEYFDSYNDLWEFRLEEDYTGHARDTLYVYDGWDSDWKDGCTYYLFLDSREMALYPHTRSTCIWKKPVLEVGDEYTWLFDISMADLPGEIQRMVEQRKVGSKLRPGVAVSDETGLAAIAAQASMILETSLTAEQKYNQYVAHYTLREPRVLCGPENRIDPEKKTQPIFSLPPGLDLTKRYYLFFKFNADNDMVVFSRAYPVLETSQIDEETLLSYRK